MFNVHFTRNLSKIGCISQNVNLLLYSQKNKNENELVGLSVNVLNK